MVNERPQLARLVLGMKMLPEQNVYRVLREEVGERVYKVTLNVLHLVADLSNKAFLSIL